MRISIAVLVGLLLVTLGWQPAVLAAIDPATLVGAWLMEDSGDEFIPDASGNDHVGELIGQVVFVDGQVGQAMELDGGGQVLVIPEFGMFSPTTEVTITLWTKLKGIKEQDILSFDPLLGGNRTTVHFPWGASGIIWQHGTDQHWCATQLPAETFDNWEFWTFVGSTKGNYLRILRNMEQMAKREDEPTAKPAFAQSAQNWNIGGRAGSSYDGAIDEVAVFNVALSDEDIGRIMDLGVEAAVLGKPVEPAGKLASVWGSMKTSN
jgi:hypothetical protein